MEAVALRDADGALRQPAAVIAQCERLVEVAVAQGRRVLLHCVDVSKTGLLAPETRALQALQAHHPDHVDVVVDACQSRLSAPRVQDYRERGWIVLLTGLKFLTGPPFSGAVLLPTALYARLLARELPAGLRDYSSRAEWPRDCHAAAGLTAPGNAGLALRWAAALAELDTFNRVPDAAKHHAISRFVTCVAAAVATSPDLYLIDVPPLNRPGPGPAWDQERTILAFAMRHSATGDWLDVAAARQVHAWLNADLGPALSGTVTDRLVAHRFHVGQPASRVLAGREAGVLRISAGARLVSGEPSQAALALQDRLAREVDDAIALLAKISLILRHWSRLQHAAPTATYA